MAKMVKCKKCGNEIAKSAKVCPHCGAKQKSVSCLGVVLIVLAVIVVIGVVVAVAGGGDKSSNLSSTAGTSDVSNTTPSESSTVETVNSEPIADLNGVKVYFTGFSEAPAPAKGYYVNLSLDNTTDTDYIIQIEDVSIEDMMVPFGDYIFSPEVLAGKKLNTNIWVINLDQLGIETPITSIDLSFILLSDEDMQNGTRSLVTDSIHIQ